MVKVRPLDLDGERSVVLALLERNLGIGQDVPRFEWLYRGNPSGSAWAWGVCDATTGKVVGSASLFPRTVWIGERLVVCGQVGHFSVDAEHRSLGPAVMLQRATFEPITRGDVEFCYDCPPHDRGMTTFRRLGIAETCELHRYARPLRTGRYVAAALGGGRTARGLAAVADLGLRLRRRAPGPAGVDFAPHEGRFGEEFTALDQRIGGRLGVRAQRSAAILNWRFRDDPSFHYDVFTARRGSELVGFAAALLAGPDARVVEVCGLGDVAVGAALLETVAEQARRRGADTIHALISTGHWGAAALGRAGFVLRESAVRLVAYAAGASLKTPQDSSGRWSFAYAEYMG